MKSKKLRLFVSICILFEIAYQIGVISPILRVWTSISDFDFPLPDRPKFKIIERLTQIEPEMSIRDVQKITQGYSWKNVNRENYMVVIAFDDPENTHNIYEVHFKQNQVQKVLIFTN
jgi:hypothetical protein